jgi:ring-1,2-phenylacetyl-CoA epoxidase subunit PaaE
MSDKFILKIKNINKETKDCVSIALDIPSEHQTAFQFKPGQYITFLKSLNNEEIRRSYSICSSPFENELRVAVKKVEDGLFSTYANDQLKNGDLIEVMPPEGRFSPDLQLDNKKIYLLLAAGSGITPILSIAKSILQEEINSNVILLYGNQKTENIIFKEQLLALKNKFLQRFQINFLLSKELTEEENFYGRINSQKLNIFKNTLFKINDLDEIFICGPEEMIIDCRTYLLEQGIPSSKIHVELFGAKINTKKQEKILSRKGNVAHVKYKLNGRTHELQLDYGESSILDAALKQNSALPFACKGGVCCTCKAKLLEGTVDMLVNYGLEQDEVDNGYILTCQSYPSSNEISIDYDV